MSQSPLSTCIRMFSATVFLVTVSGFLCFPNPGAQKPRPKAAKSAEHVRRNLSKIPRYFEPNRGQVEPEAQYLSRHGSTSLLLSHDHATLVMPSSKRLSMRWAAAKPAARITPAEPQPGITSYFIGRDPSKWKTAIPHYSRVRAEEVYRGVDLEFYGNGSDLEFDFVVKPGGDPGQLRLAFDGHDRLSLDGGDLLLAAGEDSVRIRKPVVYQQTTSGRREIAAAFKRPSRGVVEFEIGEYDNSLPLVVDPVLLYSSFLGGTGFDDAQAITGDIDGNVYITGKTASTAFTPVANASPAFGSRSGPNNIYVAKLNPEGNALLYLAILGGAQDEAPDDMFIAPYGQNTLEVFVTGSTSSTDFPTTAGSYHPAPYVTAPFAFVFRLNSTGTGLIYSTYLGENGAGTGIDVNNVLGAIGFAHVSVNEGTSASVKVLNQDGSALVAVYGPVPNVAFYDVSIDSVPLFTPQPSSVWVTGDDRGTGTLTTVNLWGYPVYQPSSRGGVEAIAIRFGFAGSVIYATYLGGSGDDTGLSITANFQNSTIAGKTASPNFFRTPPNGPQQSHGGGIDGFVISLSELSDVDQWGTYFGGSGNDVINQFLNGAGAVGTTSSTNFPIKDAFQSTYGGGASDAFIAFVDQRITGPASLYYSSYFGGPGAEQGNGVFGNRFVGSTDGVSLPLVSPIQPAAAGNGDAFIARIDNPTTAPFLCLGQAAGSPTVSANGRTELVGDVVLICTGGTNGVPTQMDIQISSVVPITSRILNAANGASEALLFLDEPQPWQQQTVQPAGQTVAGANIFQGVQSGNTITFAGIPVVQPGDQDPRVFRITNLRMSAASIGLPVGSQTDMTVTLNATGLYAPVITPSNTGGVNSPPFVVIGVAQHTHDSSIRAADGTSSYTAPAVPCTGNKPQVTSGTAADFTVRFNELYYTAFRNRHSGINANNADPGIAPVASTQLGLPYQSHTGYYNPLFPATNNLNQAGLAESGTRYMAKFSNVPAGTRVWVTTRQSHTFVSGAPATLKGFLTATDQNGAGIYSPIPATVGPYAEVPISSGTGTAVWEVAGTDTTSFEDIAFGVLLSVPANSPAAGQIQVGLTLGPLGTAATPLTAAVPRYESNLTSFTVANVQSCGGPPPAGSEEIGVFANGLWYLANGNGGVSRFWGFGQAGDTPVRGDWDGNGTTNVGVYRNGFWYLANDNGGVSRFWGFGEAGDIPVAGDWDGNGTTNIGVYRNGYWYLANDNGGVHGLWGFGQAGDVPVVGDWDGNGTTNIGVYRNGYWYLANDSGGVYRLWGFGQAGDVPVVGDWDGNGTTNVGVFRNGYWYLANDNGGVYRFWGFGQTGDTPMIGDWDGNGTDNIAIFRNGLWYLANDSGGIHRLFGFGQPEHVPVAGNWDGL